VNPASLVIALDGENRTADFEGPDRPETDRGSLMGGARFSHLSSIPSLLFRNSFFAQKGCAANRGMHRPQAWISCPDGRESLSADVRVSVDFDPPWTR